MSIRHYDVQAQVLDPDEVQEARLALNLSRRGLAEILLLSPENGHARVQRWEEGSERISPQSSQCIRLWLHAKGLGPLPPWPDDRPAGGNFPGQEDIFSGS